MVDLSCNHSTYVHGRNYTTPVSYLQARGERNHEKSRGKDLEHAPERSRRISHGGLSASRNRNEEVYELTKSTIAQNSGLREKESPWNGPKGILLVISTD
jgi:hypothetical protein